jgi:hypothetical protein
MLSTCVLVKIGVISLKPPRAFIILKCLYIADRGLGMGTARRQDIVVESSLSQPVQPFLRPSESDRSLM